jgi:hypothetical protein
MFGFCYEATVIGTSTRATIAYGELNNGGFTQLRCFVHDPVEAQWGNQATSSVTEGTEFTFRIEKILNRLYYYVDGAMQMSVDTNWHAFTVFHDAKVGFGFYRMTDAVFSNYKYIDLGSAIQGTISEGAAPAWKANDDGSISAVWGTQASENYINALTLGTLSSFSAANFVMEADVSANHFKDVVIGVVLHGNGGKMIYGLLNNTEDTRAFIYSYAVDDRWGYGLGDAGQYDHSNYHLKIEKVGNILTISVNGVEKASLDTSALAVASDTNVNVGLGIYRAYDVTFSNITYTSTNA